MRFLEAVFGARLLVGMLWEIVANQRGNAVDGN